MTVVSLTLGLCGYAVAQEKTVTYLDPVCIAKKAKACVDSYYNNRMTSHIRCSAINGNWDDSIKRCDLRDDSWKHLVAERCLAHARIEHDVGEKCARKIASTDAILEFLRAEYLAGVKAVLEESRDAAKQKP
ncbi:hypothetical protein ACERNI_13490 [Camelimonas sp. ID_303_24]